ncbi:PGPGW domain-containing protein [Arthrobacter crystallopoietes]|nr:PGPGW domain-containing protein [Arthrobacter crystallopoietes]
MALGIAGLVLPGPGLFTIAGGLAVLSRHYPWATHLLERVRFRGLK